jgi:hypothetical protein
MATINTTWGSGGIPLCPSNDNATQPSIADFGRDAADDFETLRLKVNAILAKLDLEATLAGNYVLTLELLAATIKTKKGTI